MKVDCWQSLAYSFCQVDDSREGTKKLILKRNYTECELASFGLHVTFTFAAVRYQ